MVGPGGVRNSLFSLATGVFYFTWTVVGVTLSLSLSLLIFGLLFALLFFGTTRVLALVESRIVEMMLGERMPRRPVYTQPNQSIWQRITETFADVRTWSTLLYFVLMLPLGIAYFTIAVTGIATSLSFVLAPLAYLIIWTGWLPYDFTVNLDIDGFSLLPAVVAGPLLFVLGVVLMFGLLHLARGVARFQGALAKALLVRSGT